MVYNFLNCWSCVSSKCDTESQYINQIKAVSQGWRTYSSSVWQFPLNLLTAAKELYATVNYNLIWTWLTETTLINISLTKKRVNKVDVICKDIHTHFPCSKLSMFSYVAYIYSHLLFLTFKVVLNLALFSELIQFPTSPQHTAEIFRLIFSALTIWLWFGPPYI